METLLHFSEDSDITRFAPRPHPHQPDKPPCVWAIDDAHAFLYYFPRDCPRVTFWALPTSTPDDVERFLGHTSVRRIAAIEGAWLERMRTTALYVYRLPAAAFVSLHDAGMHISHEIVTPLSVEPVGDLMARLRDDNVELRITSSLWPLRHAVVASTLHYSIIRMRNAQSENQEGAARR